MNDTIYAVMVAILASITLTSSTFAHVSSQQRYNDGFNAGQDYAACNYNNCDHSAHGYDMGCPNDKKHTYQYCDGYSLGYKTKWNSLGGGTTMQQQTQSQAQGGSSVRVDGSHNNVVIVPRQTQEQAASSSDSDSNNAEYSK
jgi:hypothetical protein